MLRIFDRIKASAIEEDIRAVLSGVSDFHNTVLDTINNEPLRGMLARIHTRVAIMRLTTLSAPGRLPNAVSELSKVFEAIKKQDATAAERAFIAHIESVALVAREELKRQHLEQPMVKPMKRKAKST